MQGLSSYPEGVKSGAKETLSDSQSLPSHLEEGLPIFLLCGASHGKRGRAKGRRRKRRQRGRGEQSQSHLWLTWHSPLNILLSQGKRVMVVTLNLRLASWGPLTPRLKSILSRSQQALSQQDLIRQNCQIKSNSSPGDWDLLCSQSKCNALRAQVQVQLSPGNSSPT